MRERVPKNSNLDEFPGEDEKGESDEGSPQSTELGQTKQRIHRHLKKFEKGVNSHMRGKTINALLFSPICLVTVAGTQLHK